MPRASRRPWSNSIRSFTHAHSRNEVHLVQRQARPLGEGHGARARRTRCTTAPRCSKACAPTRRRAARRSSACAITRAACSTRPRSIASTFRSREEQINHGLPRGHRAERPARAAPTCARSRSAATARSAWCRRSSRRSKSRSPPGNGASISAPAEDEGVDVCVSSWQRVAPNTIPAMAKAGGNYLSSQLIGLEAKRLGFAEGIGLSTDGTVSEGAGENLFLVKDGVLLHAGRRALGARRHHARHRHARWRGARHRGARDRDPARAALPRR